jgi:hypothetical protein
MARRESAFACAGHIIPRVDALHTGLGFAVLETSRTEKMRTSCSMGLGKAIKILNKFKVVAYYPLPE